jgi:hypothetical protein
MTETAWLKCADLERLISFCKRSRRPQLTNALIGGNRERKQRLFLVACCRRIPSGITESASQKAIETAEAYADGLSNRVALEVAHSAARDLFRRVNASANYAGYCAVCAATEVSGLDFKQGFNRCLYCADCASLASAARLRTPKGQIDETIRADEKAHQSHLFRDVFGNPFRPVTFLPAWRTDTAVSLARTMYDAREFGAMPVLADALQDAGCEDEQILMHCRDANQVHVRGCWVCDLVLSK